jgi:MFS family permease
LGLLLIGVTQFLVTLPFAVAPVALHEVTPNQYRGQIIAIYLFFINLIGLGLGPLFVGLITDYVFGDESMLRYSMLIIAVVLLPLSGFILARSTITFLDFKESV